MSPWDHGKKAPAEIDQKVKEVNESTWAALPSRCL